MEKFTGWIVRKDGATATAALESLDIALLDEAPEGADELDVRVLHSSLNYKDALVLHRRPGVVRRHPLVAGIDLVGEVVASRDDSFTAGDVVVLNGAGLSETLHGGLATRARIGARDAVTVPDAFTPSQAAAIGTAGLTAALSILALIDAGITPDDGPVLVTGTGGGVGSVAVSMLAALGHEVHAVTGRPDELGEQLRARGAVEVVARAELDQPGRPLARQRWAAAVDAVGGHVLVNALAGLYDGGVATCCGNAAGLDLPANIAPFILRGVSLLGIDSVRIDPELRARAWQLLAQHLDGAQLDQMTRTVALAEAQETARKLLEGRGTGRTVVDCQA
ncbi:MDR family oxidoreductase [Luteococcus sediminum]